MKNLFKLGKASLMGMAIATSAISAATAEPRSIHGVPVWGLGEKGSPLYNTIGLGKKGSPLHNTIGLDGHHVHVNGTTIGLGTEGSPLYNTISLDGHRVHVNGTTIGLGTKGSPLYNTISVGVKKSPSLGLELTPVYNIIDLASGTAPAYNTLGTMTPQSGQVTIQPVLSLNGYRVHVNGMTESLGQSTAQFSNGIGRGSRYVINPSYPVVGSQVPTGGYINVLVPVTIPVAAAIPQVQAVAPKSDETAQVAPSGEPVQCMINSVAALTSNVDDCEKAGGSVTSSN